MTVPKDPWTALRLRSSTRDRLAAFCKEAGEQRGMPPFSLASGIALLLDIYYHLPPDTRLEE